jgi:hypothetical protein
VREIGRYPEMFVEYGVVETVLDLELVAGPIEDVWRIAPLARD